MKKWSKQQKREHEVMLKLDKFKKDNPKLYWEGEMQEALEIYFSNKRAISDLEYRLKNRNVFLDKSIERIYALIFVETLERIVNE
tara:strand:+ start:331 stop:585 length:255 start_codon:yes stop_codon:yes gene_type:complete